MLLLFLVSHLHDLVDFMKNSVLYSVSSKTASTEEVLNLEAVLAIKTPKN